MSNIVVRDARRRALEGLIDYAGLFPPASLDMPAAVAGYRAARRHDSAWLVHRFICPVNRLDELTAELVATMRAGEEPWPVSLLFADGAWPEAIESQVAHAVTHAAMLGPAARFDLAELKIPADLAGSASLESDLDEVLSALAPLDAIPAFFEVRRATVAHDLVALAEVRRRRRSQLGAKLRCGGLTAADFPAPEEVARFVVRCRELGLPFKATAGLHHPFRHRAEGTGFVHHGFVNLLAAATLAAVHDLDESRVAEIIADTNPESFSLSRRAVRWRDLEADDAATGAARNDLFVGYGSCDFDEPAGDLTRLGVLPIEATV